MKKISEGAHSCEYVKWFGMQYPNYADLLHHSPNEGRRNPRTGAYLKKMGMQRGWPDYSLMIPSGKFNGMFLEMKLPEERGKNLPPHQRSKLKKLSRMGYYCGVAYGASEAIELTKIYLTHPSNVLRFDFNDATAKSGE